MHLGLNSFIFILQLGRQDMPDTDQSTSSSSEDDFADDEEPRRGRRRQKFNVEKVISSIIKDRARDRVVSKKIKDLIHGKDASASSKQSFGYWISTLMPHISNKRFLQYAVDIMHHTIANVQASEADLENSSPKQRSASAPPPANRPEATNHGDSSPLNLSTPPRKRPKSSQQATSTMSTQPSTSHQPPQQQTAYQGQIGLGYGAQQYGQPYPTNVYNAYGTSTSNYQQQTSQSSVQSMT